MSNAVAVVRAGTEGGAEAAPIEPPECALQPQRPTVKRAHTIMQAHRACSTAIHQRQDGAAMRRRRVEGGSSRPSNVPDVEISRMDLD